MEDDDNKGSDQEMEEEYLDEDFEEDAPSEAAPDIGTGDYSIEVNIDPLPVTVVMDDAGGKEEIMQDEDEFSASEELSPRYAHLCIKCKKKFRTQASYKAHIARAHSSSSLCGLCGVSFLNELGLRLHTMRKHPGTLAEQSEVKKVWCVECKLHFPDAASYASHTRTCRPRGIVKPQPGECLACDALAGVCRDHQPVLKCEQCGEQMENNRVYQVHFRRAHPDKNLIRVDHVCQLCGEVFHSITSFREHVFAHTGASYQCEACYRAFNRKELLDMHMKTHYRDKLHRCNICGQKFTYLMNLQRHLTKHKRPYICVACGGTFQTQASLKTHEKVAHPTAIVCTDEASEPSDGTIVEPEQRESVIKVERELELKESTVAAVRVKTEVRAAETLQEQS